MGGVFSRYNNEKSASPSRVDISADGNIQASYHSSSIANKNTVETNSDEYSLFSHVVHPKYLFQTAFNTSPVVRLVFL